MEFEGGTLFGDKLTYAKLAAASYKKSKSPIDIDGYMCDRSYEQTNSSVYINEQKIECVLSCRGTDPRSKEDIMLDAMILISDITLSDRFKQLCERMESLFRKYDNYRIVVTGHSKGAELSRSLLLKFPNRIAECYIFNSGAGFGVLVKGIMCKFKFSNECRIMKDKLHIYTVPGDVISFISNILPSSNKTIEKNKSFNPLDLHKMDNFTGKGMNIKQLKHLCKSKKIRGFSKLKKHELIKLIKLN